MNNGEPNDLRPLSIQEVREGQSSTYDFEFTRQALDGFIDLSGDRAPLHTDPAHAAAMGYDSLVVHGFFVAVPYSRLLGMFLPGSNSVIHSLELKMRSPVKVGERIRYRVEVKRVVPSVSSVQLELRAENQERQLVNEGTAVCAFRR